MKRKINRLVEHPVFQSVITVIILVNAAVLGFETLCLSDSLKEVLRIIDLFSIGIFVVEMVLRIYAKGIKNFFREGWNIFDFVITFISIIPVGSTAFSTIRILRSIRVFRILRVTRLFGIIKKLRIIIDAIMASLASVGWTCLLLLVILYIYAIIGINLFENISPEYFGGLGRTMYTLFQLMAADDLGNITRPIVYEIPLASIYFISFFTITILLIVNVIVGIMVDSIEDVRNGYMKEELSKANDKTIKNKIEKMREELDELEILFENEIK